MKTKYMFRGKEIHEVGKVITTDDFVTLGDLYSLGNKDAFLYMAPYAMRRYENLVDAAIENAIYDHRNNKEEK